jgi:hypothetical protein
MPETCRDLWQNKFRIFGASNWLFYTKLVTLHGHLNIKFWQHTAASILTLHSTLKFLRKFSKKTSNRLNIQLRLVITDNTPRCAVSHTFKLMTSPSQNTLSVYIMPAKQWQNRCKVEDTDLRQQQEGEHRVWETRMWNLWILMNKQNCEARERTTSLTSSGYVKTDNSAVVIMRWQRMWNETHRKMLLEPVKWKLLM